MANVDSYLLHSFSAVDDNAELESMSFNREEPVLPMLVRLSEGVSPESIGAMREVHITSTIGDIVACQGTLNSLAGLQEDPRVLSIEASRPTSGTDCAVSIPFVGANSVHRDLTNPEEGDEALVAVIDNGIDVLHEAFQDDNGNTRIVALWDQTDTSGSGPVIPGCVSYGTLHTESQINGYIASGAVPANLGRDPGGHGTHVASIAAGRAVGTFAGGMAPSARLVVVISSLKVHPWDAFSIGYSTSHVDALAFIAQESEQRQLPVAVNVSQGMNAGAHDGTSCLESAFDNFSGGGRTPGRVIVKSAGNERHFAGHSRFSVSSRSVDELQISSTASHGGPDVIELWFRACDAYQFRLFDPWDESSPKVGTDESQDGTFSSGNRYQIVYEKFHWDNGDSRLLVTISRGKSVTIAKGEWRIEVEGLEVRSEGVIHAWLERENTRPVQFANHLWEDFTLSVPGTARTVIAVASVAPSFPIRVARYSSFGPTRDDREKPDIAAPGEDIEAAKSGTASGVTAMSGTSMAAPHVTGAIALLLSRRKKEIKSKPGAQLRQFNAAQIRAALCQSTQNYNGRSSPSTGYGVLDVQSLLDSIS